MTHVRERDPDRHHDAPAGTVTTFPASRPHLAPTLCLELCGVTVDHLAVHELLHRVRRQFEDRYLPQLALGSVNLDHLHHFGRDAGTGKRGTDLDTVIDWLMLIDGAPVERRANRVTGLQWPRLAGADLLPDVLAVAEASGARVGFLGGHEDSLPALRATIARRWPDLDVAGYWTPPRETVESDTASDELAAEIAQRGVDLLVVGLGKPRQERWIETHGAATQARTLLAFGAAADFLSGSTRRAPAWMRRAGLEWSYRLLREPRRLARRYLVQGPVALWALRHAQATVTYRETPIRSAASFAQPFRHRQSARRALAP